MTTDSQDRPGPSNNQLENPMENADQVKKGTNPIVAMSIAVLIALALAGVSLAIFLRSDIRERVHLSEQESTNSTSTSGLSDSPDETGNLTESDLNAIEANILKTATGVNSEEFGASEMTDGSLGL